VFIADRDELGPKISDCFKHVIREAMSLGAGPAQVESIDIENYGIPLL
jgi:hypothetical protein